ncbi:MAG: hypothetical protein COA43_02470 [Robiginitomaculum sp.]|nr:MAG: hypothetical protein COA43_02470 [Robiginitomaculum sp.]
MTGAKTWVDKKDFGLLILVFASLPFLSHAGGLGIAATVGVCGIAALVGRKPPAFNKILQAIPLPMCMLGIFLLWAFVSSFWSPYSSGHTLSNATKILLGVPAYLMCAFLVKKHAQQQCERNILVRILLIGMFASSVLILCDSVSNYAVTLTFDPIKDGQSLHAKYGDMVQNLGHGTSVLSLMLAPVSILFWLQGGRGKIIAIAYVIFVIACCVATNQSASLIGTVCALVFMLLANWKPKFMVSSAFIVAMCSVLFAPLLAFFASRLSIDAKNSLPFSWEERVENWGYLFEKIREHPILGHGFDAVRTFNDTHTIRGFEGRALVSLHPHNAGLHIWVELGGVGACLACIALVFAMKFLIHPGRLSKIQLVAVSGITVAVSMMASLSYGVWQDWWWAIIIFSSAQIFFMQSRNRDAI